MKQIQVRHGPYAECGCCGYYIIINGNDTKFSFAHPTGSESLLEFSKRIAESEFGKEYCFDIDWEHAELETYDC